MINEIIPRLHLCGWGDISQSQEEDANVFVVNCTKDLPLYHDGVRVSVDDSGRMEDIQKLLTFLPDIVQTIDDKLRQGKTVIVHCLAGQQRSPTVVAAYLMWKKKITPTEAIAEVKAKRREAFFCGVNFLDTLDAWEVLMPPERITL